MTVKGCRIMKQIHDKEAVRKRILSVCVRLFLEQGYEETTPKQIFEEAKVSASSFYNIFPAKSAVLSVLCEFMFENQFAIANAIVGKEASGPLLYGAETAIQLALAETNEKLREIYTLVYTEPALLDFVQRKTAAELPRLFRAYLPNCSEQDYYLLEIGTSGLMRGYMVSTDFPPEQKLSCFLRMSLRAFSVPEDEITRVIQTVLTLDIRRIASQVMQRLFAELEMRFDFKLPDQFFNLKLSDQLFYLEGVVPC